MQEIIVEGLDEQDFVLLKKIVETYKVSLNEEISFSEIEHIHNKLSQVLDYLQD
jgi:pantothenate kinase